MKLKYLNTARDFSCLFSPFSFIFLTGVFFIACGGIDTVSKQQPNIIFILTDDVGWNEFGFNNDQKSYTPRIDELRRSGLSLTQFYVHAVCAPSRTAFLTGRYPFRNWTDWRTEDFGKPSYLELLGMELVKNKEGDFTRRIHALPTEEITVAEALKDVGYYTAIMGKWGCGEWLPEHLPLGQGFDHQYGHYAWGIDYNNFTIPHNAPARFAVYDWHRNQKPIFEEGYSTDLIAGEVVDMLGKHEKEHPDQPFFYYVPFNGIHGPLEETPRYGNQYSKRYAALKCLDDGVGRILDAVENFGFSENTLIVLANDNGAIRDTMNAPYRGTKNTNFEGGVRSPCIMSWPGTIQAGSSSEELIHIADFFNTFIALGGGTIPGDRPIDGINMLPTVLHGQPSPRIEIIFEVDQSVRPPAIRLNNYKLIGEELYDISSDPEEVQNIAEHFPDVVIQLKNKLAEAARARPPLPNLSLVMTPAQPYVYGQAENENVPQWLIEHVSQIRKEQPQSWPEGKTPWPQAPKDGIIIYTGDGR